MPLRVRKNPRGGYDIQEQSGGRWRKVAHSATKANADTYKRIRESAGGRTMAGRKMFYRVRKISAGKWGLYKRTHANGAWSKVGEYRSQERARMAAVARGGKLVGSNASSGSKARKTASKGRKAPRKVKRKGPVRSKKTGRFMKRR